MGLLKLCQLTGKFNQSLLSWGAPEHYLPSLLLFSFPPLYIGTKCQLDLTCWLLLRPASIIKWISPSCRCTDLQLNCYISLWCFVFVPVGKGKKFIFSSISLSCQVVKTIFESVKPLLSLPTTLKSNQACVAFCCFNMCLLAHTQEIFHTSSP